MTFLTSPGSPHQGLVVFGLVINRELQTISRESLSFF